MAFQHPQSAVRRAFSVEFANRARPEWGMCPLSDSAKSSVVLDRDVDEEKSKVPSDPRIRCPLCGWSPRKEDRWSCTCGNEWNTFDTEGCAPHLYGGVANAFAYGFIFFWLVVCILARRLVPSSPWRPNNIFAPSDRPHTARQDTSCDRWGSKLTTTTEVEARLRHRRPLLPLHLFHNACLILVDYLGNEFACFCLEDERVSLSPTPTFHTLHDADPAPHVYYLLLLHLSCC